MLFVYILKDSEDLDEHSVWNSRLGLSLPLRVCAFVFSEDEFLNGSNDDRRRQCAFTMNSRCFGLGGAKKKMHHHRRRRRRPRRELLGMDGLDGVRTRKTNTTGEGGSTSFRIISTLWDVFFSSHSAIIIIPHNGALISNAGVFCVNKHSAETVSTTFKTISNAFLHLRFRHTAFRIKFSSTFQLSHAHLRLSNATFAH